ncbi:MAG TPA: sigma-70 family RNA polymerase sigma factor [Nitrolancea sp.]|nr:sigma-70 family RNA polymerase sigma factor [Nitrolancea sp.]
MSVMPYPIESLGDFDASPELDARLGAMALRARSEPDVRNALYRLLEFKIERFVGRYRYRAHRMTVYEIDDVTQEAFLVFCNVIDRWPGDRSFLGYFFTRFPWRLSRAVERLERGASINRLVPLEEVEEPELSTHADDALALIEAGALLDARDRALLELRAGYGMTALEVARILGMHPRSVHRLWARIIKDLRESELDNKRRIPVALTARVADGVMDREAIGLGQSQ